MAAVCPACLAPMPPRSGTGRPRVWCSGRCRRLISSLGGPVEAADYYAGQARWFEALEGIWESPKAGETAKEHRRRARLLRRLPKP
jgi:hypothetical protein